MAKRAKRQSKNSDKNRFTIIEHMFYYYPAGGKKMSEEMKKKTGAPKGNQYARTHGFYSKVLDDEEKLRFKHAVEIEGLDREIALLRVKIESLIARDPENIKLVSQAVNSLARLIATKYNIGKNDKNSLMEGAQNVLKNIGVPLGIGVMQFLKK
jgi:Zn-dependent oligopeptidase